MEEEEVAEAAEVKDLSLGQSLELVVVGDDEVAVVDEEVLLQVSFQKYELKNLNCQFYKQELKKEPKKVVPQKKVLKKEVQRLELVVGEVETDEAEVEEV